MKVTWEVEDGYVGKRRPQTLTIPDEDFEDMDEDEADLYIEQCVQEAFDATVTYVITSREERQE